MHPKPPLKELWCNLMEEGFPWWLCVVKNLHSMQETWVQSLGREDLLETEMVTHSSILASEIPFSEEAGKLQSIGWQRVGHDWATNTFTSLFFMEEGREDLAVTQESKYNNCVRSLSMERLRNKAGGDPWTSGYQHIFSSVQGHLAWWDEHAVLLQVCVYRSDGFSDQRSIPSLVRPPVKHLATSHPDSHAHQPTRRYSFAFLCRHFDKEDVLIIKVLANFL